MTTEPGVHFETSVNGIPMRHTASRQLFEYWDSLRGDRSAPERRDVDPVEMKSILGDVFFAERTQKEFVMFQFVGTRINAMHGYDLQHRSALGIWSPSSASEFIKVIERITERGVPMIVSSEGLMRGREVAEIETLLLPLQFGSRFTRFVGCHVNLGKPQAFWDEPLASCRIKAVRPLFAERTSGDEVDPEDHRNADVFANVVSIAQLYGGRRIAHLTVIDGGAAS
jgi:hypothetical protein